MAAEDILANVETLEAQLETTRAAHRADTSDVFAKLQYRAAMEALAQYRKTWRKIDEGVGAFAEGDPYLFGKVNPDGTPTRHGRRGGEGVHVDDNTEGGA